MCPYALLKNSKSETSKLNCNGCSQGRPHPPLAGTVLAVKLCPGGGVPAVLTELEGASVVTNYFPAKRVPAHKPDEPDLRFPLGTS